ncbi:MAG: CRTAC1 family protein [Cytophagales bacterium]|nr:CRTAC1 family protein [Cytophagales bacterium]
MNKIEDSEEYNIERCIYWYNGAGVAVGDINNDGLADIYLASNQGANSLYVNQGDLKFLNVSEAAGIKGDVGMNKWTTGVTMADINTDGWLDIYVCELHGIKGVIGRNRLFINQKDGTFVERASAYGLDIRSYSQQASFFDYDLDGDLDMFLLNQSEHSSKSIRHGDFRVSRDSLAGDRLYKNNNGRFEDVSETAGIYGGSMGYGLSFCIGDINNDCYPDIYVANDFHENDYIYYNKKDGTFEENVRSSFGHTSFSSMGSDLADFNNDGWLDLIVLDMKSNSEQIQKMSLTSDDHEIYQSRLEQGYHYQYQRNVLQVNRGVLWGAGCQFSEIGEYAGISATGWSWAPLFADLDLDSKKDLFITNGIPRSPIDLDYLDDLTARSEEEERPDWVSLIEQMPGGEASNKAFRNIGNKFQDVTDAWGLGLMGSSNGSAYADFDNDGDLDLVINNLNKASTIYENLASQNTGHNYIKLKLKGGEDNRFGIGARVILKTKKNIQVQELFPVKGWLSSVEHTLTFGMGTADMVDEITIDWKDGKIQKLKNVNANQTLVADYNNATDWERDPSNNTDHRLFEEIGNDVGIDFIHRENAYNDFEYYPVIPRKLSTDGPALSVGDVNGDGLDDFFIGGARNQSSKLYIQLANNDLKFEELRNDVFDRDRIYEDVSSTFIDVDRDDDLDLYVVSGHGEFFNDLSLKDRLYINNGKGIYTKSTRHPQLSFSGSCAVVGDINQDGNDDLFVGGRSVPGKYGSYPRSRILLGDGNGQLFDASNQAFGNKINLGMVTDAVWLDESKKLIVVGDWMPITIVSFSDGKIAKSVIEGTEGWWNTIYATDIDGDHDQDLFVGNVGLNIALKASARFPVNLYIKDFDNNGLPDPILTYFKEGIEYPFFGRDKLSAQINAIKSEYPTYKSYAESSFDEVFPKADRQGAGRWQAKMFESVFIENLGDGEFELHPLPEEFQWAPINGFVAYDFDDNGKKEVLSVGNFYGNQVIIGRNDASYGCVMKLNSDKEWESIEPRETGFTVFGEARNVNVIYDNDKSPILLIGKNNDVPQLMQVNNFSL